LPALCLASQLASSHQNGRPKYVLMARKVKNHWRQLVDEARSHHSLGPCPLSETPYHRVGRCHISSILLIPFLRQPNTGNSVIPSLFSTARSEHGLRRTQHHSWAIAGSNTSQRLPAFISIRLPPPRPLFEQLKGLHIPAASPSENPVYSLMTEQNNVLFIFGRTQKCLAASSPLQ
jgi:hypothetical protein